MAQLELRALTKRFGSAFAVEGFDLTVAPGELVCLLGPSGSGKSTVLRMIGGFETATGGQVLIDGEDVTRLAPEKRPTSMMFQSHALWSHMTVAGNIGFGLRLRRLPRAQIAQQVAEALELVGLAGMGARRTDQLSGGQQQRVALARSLVLEPKILLLDEPFASLDQHLRERLREEVRDLQHRLGITMIFVTHGQDEALALADRIVVMRDGAIQQVDRPDLLYRKPETPFVAGFIGQMNMMPVEISGGRITHPAFTATAEATDGPALLAVRPEAIGLHVGHGAGRLRRTTDFGSHAVVEVDLPDGTTVKALLPGPPGVRAGTPLTIVPLRYHLFRGDRVIWASDGPALSGSPRVMDAANG